ncbi:MAG: alanine/glycine:cation symporter family protein [Fusobacteriaceae bacterium]
MDFVVKLNSVLWGNFMLALLLGTGIFFTLRLRFVQFRKFGEGVRRITGGLSLNGKAADENGMSSFQALSTAIAAQVGTGNLAGAATAIAAGGPGAIFWMWVSAVFGMATVYAEAVLGQVFKKKVDGQITGGPAYYIKHGLGDTKIAKFLAGFFAVSCILALGFMGNAVQANSISSAFENAFGISPIIVGIVVAVLSGFVFFGGIKRIASVTEKIVPLMAALYIIACVIILFMNWQAVLPAFKSIFVEAFSPRAAVGGVAGISVKTAMRYGVARGLFSNEAGMGSTPHAHAIAKVEHPAQQGAVAILTVFIDTFVVLNCTALVIISSGLYNKGMTGITLTQGAFQTSLGGFGHGFVAICLLFFAFSTIIGWYFFGEANIRFLFGNKMLTPYRIIVMGFIILGSFLKVGLVWELSDAFNALMVFPNLIALLALQSIVKKNMDEYEEISNKK